MKRLMLGNEAIAHGALAAGVALAAGYPGTPSTEVLEALEAQGDRVVHWASNEKVAFELAYGAAVAGARALAAMKHVGLNVAADPLHSAAYTGVEGGLVVVSADDPWMYSSQNEQDNRWYGLQAYVPVLEPSDPAEAYAYTKAAFDLSEKLKMPVMLRTVTRVSHVRAPLEVEPPAPPRRGHFRRDPQRYTLVPAHARQRRLALLERWEEAKAAAGAFLSVEGEGPTVVASGVAYAYVKEALRRLGASAKVVKVGMPVPLPPAAAEAAGPEAVVVEEGEPVVEMQLRAMGVRTLGKLDGLLPRAGELSTAAVAEGLAKAFGLPHSRREPPRPPMEPPPRPPYLCPGCPHLGTFYALKVGSAGRSPIWSGDIGCYSLGVNFGQQDLLTHMGSSVGLGMGIALATGSFTVATVGDSTFFHSVLPQLADLALLRVPLLVVVFDNAYTAMTGGQPSPSRVVDIAKVVEAFGIEAFVVDPADVKAAVGAVKRAVEVVKGGRPAVVVARRPCTLEGLRVAREEGLEVPRFAVDLQACRACTLCYGLLRCAAISRMPDGKAWIDPSLCVGCRMCADVCPFDAIGPTSGDVERWREVWMSA